MTGVLVRLDVRVRLVRAAVRVVAVRLVRAAMAGLRMLLSWRWSDFFLLLAADPVLHGYAYSSPEQERDRKPAEESHRPSFYHTGFDEVRVEPDEEPQNHPRHAMYLYYTPTSEILFYGWF